MELVGHAAADIARVGQHRTVFQPQALEDAAVGAVHKIIGFLQRRFAAVKRIGIFHEKFARAHDTEAGAALISEFGLNLVEVGRQLPVAVEFIAYEISDDLFMCRAKTEITVMAVHKAQQLGAHLVPASGLYPQIRRLHHWHGHFHGPGTIHLLADDGSDFLQNAKAGRQPGVHASGQFANQACTDHELVADNFGIGRSFL